MEVEELSKWTQQSNSLRQDLKAWEKEFAAANGGRKAGRDDIKQHPTIAQKYKDYNKARDILSGKVSPPKQPEPKSPRKRKHESRQTNAPSKRHKVITPCKNVLHPAEIDPYDSPSIIRNLFTPLKNRVIGPTPQKDGQALGLFDLLPSGDEGTPSSKTKNASKSLRVTPSKSKLYGIEESTVTRHSRTPASSGKRFMLDIFATPLKRRHPNEQTGQTPSSVSKLQFSTPSFLRRDSQRTTMATIEEGEDSVVPSPEMTRMPKRPLVRGLSSMLAGLRKMEEEAADDDLDALHEMENSTGNTVKPMSKNPILVEDSRFQLPLGGFDDEAMYDSEPEEELNASLGPDGLPVGAYKKKGQKRSTRKVTMKPVRSKPNPQPLDERGAKETPCDDEAITDTQVLSTNAYTTTRNYDSDSGSDYTASEGGTRYRRPDQNKKKKLIGPDGKVVVEKMRKVGAMAHANFKRLKLRNSGAKGGPGVGSKFRRRK